MLFRRLFSRGDRVDPRPVAVPAGMKLPETAEQKMQRMIRVELSKQAQEAGFESFQDANDFDVPDDDPTLSPTSYEMVSEVMEGLKHGEYEGPGFGEERDSKRERGTSSERKRGDGDSEERESDDGHTERTGGAREDAEFRGSHYSRSDEPERTRTGNRGRYSSESRRSAASRSGDGRGRDED